jgi:hypothetical protein
MAQVPFPITTFQYPNTYAVANGYLIVRLNKDCQVISPPGQIGAKLKIKVPLNNGGSPTDTVTFWPNNALDPDDSVYIYSVYNAEGQIILGPASLVITASGSNTGFGESFGTSFGS